MIFWTLPFLKGERVLNENIASDADDFTIKITSEHVESMSADRTPDERGEASE
ncbi:hypothetical protein CZ774_04760 [Frigoribacterium sp. JB110]|nr:hypothetical protein CZ774_04760 [Frigoribacterium sp. JB110]